MVWHGMGGLAFFLVLGGWRYVDRAKKWCKGIAMNNLLSRAAGFSLDSFCSRYILFVYASGLLSIFE